ncbi:TPA: hypothetical protein RUU96_002561 [Staphylococcus aureus]|nr:hypothetical protein [Staphylococcus aureus]HDZ8697866.1 hypothetical protein [Staphylococcus aureus]
MNILDIIKSILVSDEIISSHLGERVYYYQVTENADTSKAFIVLTPISDVPFHYASDKYLSEQFLIQIDVESESHQITTNITKKIRYLLYQHGLFQASSQLDAYFDKTKRYVMSRRYQGVPKNIYYKNERIE